MACSEQSAPSSDEEAARATTAARETTGAAGSTGARNGGSHADSEKKPPLVDPREGGFEITLGEWAITPEAPALRPGPVTFVVHNRGTMAHGFEIELEGDSSGSGSGDIFKAEGELLEPGESARLRLHLAPGVHKIECLVEGHDDLGMEGPLEVREDAPFVREEARGDDGTVAIADFAFDPEVVEVPAGSELEWRNEDPAPHTVTALEGRFDSGTLDPDQSFSFTFENAGTYHYRCNIHPDMTGTVKVE